ncbi:MAG: alpha-galactosidase, partial [Bacteroidales bacterium]|nr:alpha-galactosidase [Bacteroidales bacterium]
MNKIVRFLSIAAAMIIALAPAYARKVKKVAPKEHTTVEIPKVTKQVIAVETSSTQLILLVNANGTVQTCHYGRKIADPNEFLNYNSGLGSLYGDGAVTYPAQGGRFISEPALSVKYADGYRNTELYFAGVNKVSKDLVNTTEVLLKDYVTGLEVKLVYDAYLKEDVILSHSEITNAGKAPVTLIDYASSSMYVRGDKFLLTHTYGDWSAEMQIDREVLTHNIKVIETKRGTQATQWNNPSFMLSLNTDSFSETDGDVIAGSLAWSGNFRISFEKDVTHNLNIVAGINPFSSEYELAQNQTFITPDMIWTFSSEGAGQASRNIHAWARNFGVYGGAAIKPTLLNSWEGAYFSFNTETLLRMIDDAAAMGLEMFVLDDGWFAMDYPRDSDKQGLGDWEV